MKHLISLLLRMALWFNILSFEKVCELTWDFFEHLPDQLVRIILELSIRHKLHYVCLHIFLVPFRVQGLLIGI